LRSSSTIRFGPTSHAVISSSDERFQLCYGTSASRLEDLLPENDFKELSPRDAPGTLGMGAACRNWPHEERLCLLRDGLLAASCFGTGSFSAAQAIPKNSDGAWPPVGPVRQAVQRCDHSPWRSASNETFQAACRPMCCIRPNSSVRRAGPVPVDWHRPWDSSTWPNWTWAKTSRLLPVDVAAWQLHQSMTRCDICADRPVRASRSAGYPQEL